MLLLTCPGVPQPMTATVTKGARNSAARAIWVGVAPVSAASSLAYQARTGSASRAGQPCARGHSA